MCFVHPSTVPQCDVYKSAGVTLSWSSNDWSPSINGTRACGDIDLFWSEQTAPRDFLCHILGLDPDLPRSSLKVEYMQMAIMIRVSGNNYPSGSFDDRNPWCVDDMCLTQWLQNRCSVHWSPCWNIDQRMQDGEKRKRDVGKVLNQLLHSHCSSHCEAEVRQYWILNILPYTVCGQSSHSQIGGNNVVWWKHFQKTLNSWTEMSEAHLKLFKSELRWKQAAWLPSNEEGG